MNGWTDLKGDDKGIEQRGKGGYNVFMQACVCIY